MKRIAITLVTLAMMVAPASAMAQSSTCQAYSPQLCNESTSAEGTASAATSGVTSTGTLPFTGIDVGLLALGGGVLLVAGVVLRPRINRQR